MPYHATPNAGRLLEQGYTGGIPEYAWESHFDLLYEHLPPPAQERVRRVAEETDATLAGWGVPYWANLEPAIDALIAEYESLYPNSQMIWSKPWPSREQIESYGPEMVHFDEYDLEELGETADGLAHMYHPREGETGIPGELFRRVDPHRLMETGRDEPDWDDEED